MYQIIPLDNSPNQTFDITLNIFGKNKTLNLGFTYIKDKYWKMSIVQKDTCHVASVPLLFGDNLLDGLEYLELGKVYLLKVSDIQDEIPNENNLATDFALKWGSDD